jgi:short subunit dehydrogenase-like uncharacterized protein
MKRAGQRVYDAIVYSATGDTGSAAVRLLYHYAHNFNIKSWTMSARDIDKLETNVLSALRGEGGVKWTGDPIKADSTDWESLLALCKQTKVVVACAGPYAKYGESIIAACIQTGTHYVDITGETAWVNQMQRRYNKAAKEAGVSVVSFCGYDSIPSDMSAFLLANGIRAEGDKADIVETYVASKSAGGGAIPTGTTKTVLSMVNKVRYKYSFGLLGEAPEPKNTAVPAMEDAGTRSNDGFLTDQVKKASKRDAAVDGKDFVSEILLDKPFKSSPHFMNQINRPVVHATAEKLGFDFKYYERQVSGGKNAWDEGERATAGAALISPWLGLVFAPLVLTPFLDSAVLAYVRWYNGKDAETGSMHNVVQKLMNRGEGTGYVGMKGYAKGERTCAESTFETDYEAGIGTTMLCACAVAGALAGRKEKGNGFETPVVALGGEVLKEALTQAGVRITLQVAPIKSKL